MNAKCRMLHAICIFLPLVDTSMLGNLVDNICMIGLVRVRLSHITDAAASLPTIHPMRSQALCACETFTTSKPTFFDLILPHDIRNCNRALSFSHYLTHPHFLSYYCTDL